MLRRRNLAGYLTQPRDGKMSMTIPVRLRVSVSFLLCSLFGVTFTGAATFRALSPRSKHGSDSKGPEGQLLNSFIKEIEGNYERLQTVDFRVVSVVESSEVKKEEKVVATLAGGGTMTAMVYPRLSTEYNFTLRGADLRRHLLPGQSVPEEVAVLHDGKALQYSPAHKRAWIRTAPVNEIDPLDPRCWGFEPPISSITQWLSEATISDVRSTTSGGEPVDIVQAVDRKGQAVSVTLSATRNHLPIAVDYSYQDGSLSSAAELAYQELPGLGSWFLKKAVICRFAKGATRNADPNRWGLRRIYQVKGQPKVNGGIPMGAFEPLLPRGTVVSDPRGKSVELSQDRPAFTVFSHP